MSINFPASPIVPIDPELRAFGSENDEDFEFQLAGNWRDLRGYILLVLPSFPPPPIEKHSKFVPIKHSGRGNRTMSVTNLYEGLWKAAPFPASQKFNCPGLTGALDNPNPAFEL
jgi:hypothetical protein